MATTTKPTKPTTTLDFSKVFSTNAPSTPFTWTDSDYLEGWDSIQNTPPSRQQFNALHMLSDKKENWLYSQYLEGYVDKFLDYLDTVKAPINSPTFTGDPKAPTPAKNDNDTSIATTAFVKMWVGELSAALDENGTGIVEGSVAGSGYVKFKNGFIIQWGVGITGPGGFATGSFPISFPHKCCGVYVSGDEATLADWHKILQGAPLSLSTFEITSYDVISGSGSPSDGMHIMAIGY